MGTREALDKWLADSEQALIDYDGTDGMRCRPVTDDDKDPEAAAKAEFLADPIGWAQRSIEDRAYAGHVPCPTLLVDPLAWAAANLRDFYAATLLDETVAAYTGPTGPMTLDSLRGLLNHVYLTAYIEPTRMRCAPDVLASLQCSVPPIYRDPMGPPPSVFMGVSIVVDAEMAEGEWHFDSPQHPRLEEARAAWELYATSLELYATSLELYATSLEPAPRASRITCPVCDGHSSTIDLPTFVEDAYGLIDRERRRLADECRYVEWMTHFGPDGPPVRTDLDVVEVFDPAHIGKLREYGDRRVYLNGGPSDGLVTIVNVPEVAPSSRVGRYTLQVGVRGYPLRLSGHPAEPVWLYNWQGWRD